MVGLEQDSQSFVGYPSSCKEKAPSFAGSNLASGIWKQREDASLFFRLLPKYPRQTRRYTIFGLPCGRPNARQASGGEALPSPIVDRHDAGNSVFSSKPYSLDHRVVQVSQITVFDCFVDLRFPSIRIFARKPERCSDDHFSMISNSVFRSNYRWKTQTSFAQKPHGRPFLTGLRSR